MYVSGSLKDKTVNFYKDKMIDFDEYSFNTSEVLLSYDGCLSFVPWESKKSDKLSKNQELYINKLIENIKLLNYYNCKCGTYNIAMQSMYKKVLEYIMKTNRKITYALLECFYKLIVSQEGIVNQIRRFYILIDYLNQNIDTLTQVNLDVIIELFLNKFSYTKDDIYAFKKDKFKIDERDIIDEEIYKLVLLGQFIAPNRLPVIANSLYSYNEFTKYVVPIYLTIKNDKDANQFLYSCKNPNLSFEQIEKNATLCRTPNNLINMVRR